MYGFGARSRGMAGAMTAVSDDFSALYYNPAALSQRRGNLIQFGFVTSTPNAEVKLDPAAGISHKKRVGLSRLEEGSENLSSVRGTELGMVLSPHDRLKGAIGMYFPQQQAVTLHPVDIHEPVFILHDHFSEKSAVMMGLSYTIIPGLAVGFGTSVFADVRGDLKIPLEARSPDDVESGGVKENSEVTIDFPWTIQPFGGVFFQPHPQWRFGAAYRSEFGWDVIVKAGADVALKDFEIDLSALSAAMGDSIKAVVTVDAPALGDTPLEIPLEIEGLEGRVIANAQASLAGALVMIDLWTPQQVGLGAAYDPTDQWTISLDSTWADWSAMESPELEFVVDDVNVSVQTLPASVRARLRNVTIPVLGTVGSIPPVTVAIPGLDASFSVPIKFQTRLRPPVHDVIHPRLGVEYRCLPLRSRLWTGPLGLSLRGGYSYEPSPFEPDGGYVNVIDPDRHLFSTGLGAEFNRRFKLDTYFQYRYLSPVSVDKDYVDEDMPFRRMRAVGDIWTTGLQAGVGW